MKRTTISVVLFACLVVVLLVINAFTAVSSANAQLGNTGVPVRCDISDFIANGSSTDMNCVAADGTSFTNVPTGHYLMVTDVTMVPIYYATSGRFLGRIVWKNGNLDVKPVWLVTLGAETISEHFTVPYLVLPAGHHLEAANFPTSASYATFYVSGLLTTNYNYIPMVVR